MATDHTHFTAANRNSQAYRAETKPRAFTCDCGKPAAYRIYDVRRNETRDVCASCKEGK